MSFSSQIKEELAETAGSARHCQIAEIAALLSMGGQVAGVEKGHPKVIFRTENLLVARKYFTLLRKTFNINTEISVRRNLFLQKNGNYILLVSKQEDVEKLISAARMKPLAESG